MVPDFASSGQKMVVITSNNECILGGSGYHG
jgi:hypothetical protein